MTKIILADGLELVPGKPVYLFRNKVEELQTDETAHIVCDGWLRLRDEAKYPHDGLKHSSYLYATPHGPVYKELKIIDEKINELIERREILEHLIK